MRYIALTIGPIYKTLQNAKKPKELWSGSYFFSYFMKKIIEEFKDREFVIPYIKDEEIFQNKDVGLFHDRFIFQSKDGDLKKLEESVLPKLYKEIGSKLELDHSIIESYLQINYLEKELKDDQNPIIELTPYLDTKELFYKVSNNDPDELQKKLRDKKNFLVKNKKITDNIVTLSHNNYFAIVHADGDSMGEAIKNKDSIKDISKNLFNYCINSTKLVRSYGGEMIFAGGDDLLFIAPPISKDGKTIFELCEDISQAFDIEKATLSFGISITFESYPLYEALKLSKDELFNKAKNTKGKNAISFVVQKHSGQIFGETIQKSNYDVYKNFLSLTSKSIDYLKKDEDKDQDKNFLHSIHHKLDLYKEILLLIGKDKKLVDNFFENYFNEDEHKKYKKLFQELSSFIVTVFKDSQEDKNDPKELRKTQEKSLNTVYAALRYIKFIIGDKS